MLTAAGCKMLGWISEESESDTRTSYPVTQRIWEGATDVCESVSIAESSVFGRMLFLDGELQSAAADEHIYHETLVHPAMAAAPSASRVLVVGGGEGATVREVLKWKPTTVDWIDIDRVLVQLCDEHLKWAPDVLTHPNVRYQGRDIRDALPTLGQYDVIILDLPDPDGDTGYLYSTQFMRDMQAHLNVEGFIVTHCGPVRPFGRIGEGYQRLLPMFGFSAFYTQAIPSFQGEWGFMIWPAGRFHRAVQNELPPDLRIVDKEQIHRWFHPTKLWYQAIISAGDMYTSR
jgi:spermidine synthase